MAIGTGPTSTLCRWVCSTQYETLPPEVRKEAVTLLYDQVGCMIASATLPSCRPVVELVRKLGSAGECSIVGHPVRTSVTNAALANGTIGHGDEVDATGQRGTGHFAAAIVPTAVCVGQYVGSSGKELSRAIALGSEVAGRFVSTLGRYGTGAGQSGSRRQFSLTVGYVMGATVSAGLLLRLDAEQMEHALGLAAGGACGLNSYQEEELHQTKSLAVGSAVAAAVLSALLAQGGFHGPKEILTMENGYFDAFAGLPNAGHDVVDRLGEDYLMREIAYKRYPVGGPDQTPLYNFLQLIKAHGLVADDIAEIEVSLARNGFHTVTTNKHPAVHLETILALAAVYGEITFPHIHDPQYLADPRIKTFQEKTRIILIPRPGIPTRGQRHESGLTIRTRSGKTLRQDTRFPLMTEAEVQQKFRSYAGLRLDGKRVADLEKKLMAIETEQNVAPLIRELELPY